MKVENLVAPLEISMVQVLLQKVNERATVLYDLAVAVYDALAKLGPVPIIDKNKRNGETIHFAPAEKTLL